MEPCGFRLQALTGDPEITITNLIPDGKYIMEKRSTPAPKKLIFMTVILSCLFSGLILSFPYAKNLFKIMNREHASQRNISFFGKLVDDKSEPINGAEVTIHFQKFSILPLFYHHSIVSIKIKTDVLGCFSLVDLKGFGLYIVSAEKPGYENTWFGAMIDGSETTGVITVINAPMVFKMRKKNKGTYLVKGDGGIGFQFRIEESGARKGFDLIESIPLNEKLLDKLQFNGYPLSCDIQAIAIFNPGAGDWEIAISSGDIHGGVIVTDELLYEAPLDGYKYSCSISSSLFTKKFSHCINASGSDLHGRDLGGVYIYIRSRNPSIYSRIKFSRIQSDREWISLIGAGYVTNPYGDRNLELADKIPVDIIIEQRENIRTAFRHSGRPFAPDLFVGNKKP